MTSIMKPKVTVLTSLYRCKAFLQKYFYYLSQLEKTDEIEVLLLHNDPTPQETDIINLNLKNYSFVKYHLIPVRESLYATWNRGILLANGEYICIWNVDDIRFPLSICWEAETLDKNPQADLTYGDLYYMYEYDKGTNDRTAYSNFDSMPHLFLNSFQMGCFPMWRKSIHNKIGYFDEQFRVVGDYDFQIRVAFFCKMVKTHKVLGYYLEFCRHKLSSNMALQKREQTLLYIRYGLWRQLDWIYWTSVYRHYKINKYFYLNNEHPVKIPASFRSTPKRRICNWVLSILHQPRNVLSYLKHDLCGVLYHK